MADQVARFQSIQSTTRAVPLARGYVPGQFYRMVASTSKGKVNETIHAPVVVFRGDSFAVGAPDLGLFVGDVIRTGPDCLCSIEFLIGGRVGINRSTAIEIVNERSVADVWQGVNRSAIRIIRKNASLWIKADAKTLKEPIEIQTNGGVLGIKG